VSEEDVAYVRETIELLTAGDDEAWQRLDKDVIGVPPAEWPEPEALRGRAAIREQFAGWDEAFGPDWPQRLKARSFEDLGGGRVLIEFRFETTGAGSGVPIDQPLAAIHRVRDGKIVRIDFFMDPEAAQRARDRE
jgi:ketosteroid isomerase-like protein